ncbi:putative receptor-like protein kinase At3g47110 [Miscanthus floridulus]|uniref:putative receptor-like protein kinase At3g47110 n=1 Tax=Miscanthus floridulus TaxID=154761 RepID=UPI00345B00B3
MAAAPLAGPHALQLYLHLLLLLIMLQLTASVQRSDSDMEQDALRAFRAGVSDASSSGALQSWNSSTSHFCRWRGVACTGGHVTSLNVSSLGLTGTISPAIGNLTYLEYLVLKKNQLSGTIPASIGSLRRLRYLDLCDNIGISGEIPDSFRSCTSLGFLYLNNNSLTGAIPGWLGTFPNLTYLYLHHNSLSGEIPPSLGSLTKLQALRLDENYLRGSLPPGLADLPSLETFSAYQNLLQGEIPPGFFNMSSLQFLALTNNAFHGVLPPYAGARMSNLRGLYLGGNNLTGPIPAALAKASNLTWLSLANNSFTGQVPPEIGVLCPQWLYMSGNQLTASDEQGWEFLDHLANCTSLQVLALDNNKLGGELPSSIGHLSMEIQALHLANNRISGTIPPGIGNLVGLQSLDLESNLLNGTIPEGIGNIKNLIELGLQGNRLTGPIPSSIGDLTQLVKLDLSSNTLSGSIPHTLAKLNRLTSLNLSGNALTGHVPREIFSLVSLSLAMDLSDNRLDGPLPPDVSGLTNLAQLVLTGNQFSGQLPKEVDNCQSLEFLDLDRNFFDGSIPTSLSKLKGLRRLNLASNKLTGSIPQELGQMSGLQELYLSRNNLTGTVPAELENLSSLIELDLSYNHIDGSVPLHGIFANISGLKIAGNADLCGGVPELDLPRCPAARNTRPTDWLLQIVVPVLSIALFLAILLSMFQWYRRRPRQANKTDDATLDDVLDGMNHQRISYAELDKATNGFADTNLIGAGKFGSVYLGTLPLVLKGASALENVAVAVKVFDLRQVGASRTFLSECEALRNVRHRNLIRIITCCAGVDASGNDFRALVFEFMPNYSLDRWVNIKSLSVVQRLNIVVDIADALCYLHNNSVPPIIHCDVKPSNVLLGEDMRAVVADFGLSKLLHEPGSHDGTCSTTSTGGLRGTIGYVPPEYGTTAKVSAQGDVYSFGITVLEIFTGRSPTDDAFKDGLTMLDLVAASFPDKIEQVLDLALLPVEGSDDGQTSCSSDDGGAHILEHDCLVSAVRVGLSCTRGVPCQRLSMKDAAAELRSIRDACARSAE